MPTIFVKLAQIINQPVVICSLKLQDNHAVNETNEADPFMKEMFRINITGCSSRFDGARHKVACIM